MSNLDLPLDLPLAPPYEPMEAETADVLPAGDGWQYELKWTGSAVWPIFNATKSQLVDSVAFAGTPVAIGTRIRRSG